MTRFKKIVAALSTALILASAMSASAAASYIDGDREVDYYKFTIEANRDYQLDPKEPTSSGVNKRYSNRNWVVSINSVSTTRYSMEYSVFRRKDPANPNNNLGYTEKIADSCTVRGTGNSGGSYVTDVCAGTTIYMTAKFGSAAPDGFKIKTSGQWSPDAPY